MLGWPILFGLMALTGATLAFAGMEATVALKIASVFFSFLFFLAVLGRVVRNRAR